MKWILLLLVPFFLLIPTASQARTWHVKQDGTGDCTTIQACINLASDGDSILVGPGTYRENLVVTVPLVLVGELGSSQTAIDGGRLSGVNRRCITCSHPSGRVYISGFKVAEGVVPEPYPNNYAGGILCTTAELELRDCYVHHNFGGGVGCRAGTNVTIINCDIVNNYGEIGDPYDTYANGVTGYNATGTFAGCRISASSFGYGVDWSGGQLELSHNEIYECSCAVRVLSTGSVWIHHNLVRNDGDGIAVGSSAVSIENNTVVRQQNYGYGIIVSGCTGSVRNNVIVSGSHYGISCNGATTLSCNDVWNNSPGNYEGTCPHPTDISIDPLFCDALSGNYCLHSSSPCANAPGCGQIGAFGMACGPTAVTETTWGRIKSMYR